MYNYETVSEALTDLNNRGFKHDFNLPQNRAYCNGLQHEYKIPRFEVKETYRFEGITDPADEAVVYAIVLNDGLYGTFVNGYGTYADADQEAFLHLLVEK